MKAIRLTPLNLISSAVLCWIIWNNVIEQQVNYRSVFLGLLLLVLMIVADMLFRFFLKTLKRVWIIELLFITATGLGIWITRL